MRVLSPIVAYASCIVPVVRCHVVVSVALTLGVVHVVGVVAGVDDHCLLLVHQLFLLRSHVRHDFWGKLLLRGASLLSINLKLSNYRR